MSVVDLRSPRGGGTGVAPAVPATAAPRALVDYDFQSVLAVPPKQRRLLWLMVGLITVATIGLLIAKVDIIIAANGKLITPDSQIVVQPLETSVVRSVAVRVGDRVPAGGVLATLDPTFSEADTAEIDAKLRFQQASFDRLEAELAGREYRPAAPSAEEATQRDVFQKRHEEYAAKLDAAERKVAQYNADLAAHKVEAEGLAAEIKLIAEQQQIYRTLVEQSLASKLKLLDMSQRRVQAQTRIDSNLGEQRKLVEQIGQAQAERDSFVHEWQRKLSEEMAQTRSDRDASAARLQKVRLRHDMAVMRAPQDATVLEIADRPPGSVVREAETVMRLVPADGKLLAEVQVDTRDVARLHLGDVVTLKLEALPWQQFGLAYGVVRTLTPDVLSDDNQRETGENMTSPDMKSQARQSTIHYRARVEVTETKFRNLPQGFALRPGMRLVGDIKVGRRSVLEYILNPITRVISESLREP